MIKERRFFHSVFMQFIHRTILMEVQGHIHLDNEIIEHMRISIDNYLHRTRIAWEGKLLLKNTDFSNKR